MTQNERIIKLLKLARKKINNGNSIMEACEFIDEILSILDPKEVKDKPVKGWKIDRDGWHCRRLKSGEYAKSKDFFKGSQQDNGFLTNSKVYTRDRLTSIDFDNWTAYERLRLGRS